MGWEAAAGIQGGSSFNTIIGAQTAFVASSINHEVMIGDAADYNLLSGDNNVLIGDNVYNNVSTSSQNTIVGSNAGVGVGGSSTNSNNVMMGYNTGNAVTTGSNNILLGWGAASGLTTGGNNIALGYNIQLPSNTSSNQLDIGNAIFGTGITGTGTTIAGNIGIGTTVPNTTLSVAGSLSATGSILFPGISNCNSTQFLQITSGVFGCGTPSGSGGGGLGAGWATSTPNIVYNNFGTVVGINSTTPIGNLVAQGVSGSSSPIFIASTSTGSSILQVSANGSVLFGQASSTTANLTLYNSTNGFGLTLRATGTIASNVTLTLPTTTPASGAILTAVDANGNLAWIVPTVVEHIPLITTWTALGSTGGATQGSFSNWGGSYGTTLPFSSSVNFVRMGPTQNTDFVASSFIFPTNVVSIGAELDPIIESTSASSTSFYGRITCDRSGNGLNTGSWNATSSSNTLASVSTSNEVYHFTISSMAYGSCAAGDLGYIQIFRSGTYTNNIDFINGGLVLDITRTLP